MKPSHNIALISASYPPYTCGGIDIQTYDLAHALSSAGENVTVFCGKAEVPTFIRENKNLEILRLPIVDMPPRVVWFQLKNIGVFRKTLPNFDLVHTQHSSGSIYGLLKKRIGKPWVVSFHDHQIRRLKVLFDVKPWNLSFGDISFYTVGCPIFEVLTRMELKGADHYIACGVSGFTDYIDFSNMEPEKTTIIPNGINLEKIGKILSLSKENGDNMKDDKDFIIFTCGRLYASKGLQYLIKAMPLVLEHFKNVRLKIFGKGPMYSYLQDLISSLNLKNNVTLEGHVSYNHLISEMSRSDLTVFPSLIEVGASIAVMEAMFCKKAVIAFKYPFSTEIIEHLKTGYHVHPKNIIALANAICLLINDKSLRDKLGSNAHDNIVKNHNYNDLVKKYIKLYSQIISMQD
jgi:glycosyltransferase involved in cell wall biosynthesis